MADTIPSPYWQRPITEYCETASAETSETLMGIVSSGIAHIERIIEDEIRKWQWMTYVRHRFRIRYPPVWKLWRDQHTQYLRRLWVKVRTYCGKKGTA